VSLQDSIFPSFLTWPTLDLLAVTAFAGLFGGFVRGYSGFGFALAAVPALALVVPPAFAIPAVLPIELAIGLATIPTERHRVAWQPCTRLIAGTVIGTPIGLYVLASIPAGLMRVIVSLVAVAAVLVLWRRPQLSVAMLGQRRLVGVGVISGLLNGGTAMSGPPAIIALLASNLTAASARATLIVFIAFSAALGTVLSAASGLLGPVAIGITVLMIPTAALGGILGIWVFAHTAQNMYRRASLALLLLVSLSAIASVIASFLHPSPLWLPQEQSDSRNE
jgi:uncharacterized protein